MIALIADVSDAFVAPPAASLPPSASSSSASRGGNTRPSSRSGTSSGCLAMSADGGGAAPGKEARRRSFLFLSKRGKKLPKRGALSCWGRPACAHGGRARWLGVVGFGTRMFSAVKDNHMYSSATIFICHYRAVRHCLCCASDDKQPAENPDDTTPLFVCFYISVWAPKLSPLPHDIPRILLCTQRSPRSWRRSFTRTWTAWLTSAALTVRTTSICSRA